MQKFSQIHPLIEIRVPCPFLTTATQKLLKYIILNFPEFGSTWKSSSVPPFIHPFTLWPGWPQPFLATPTPIFFYQLFHFWYQHLKKYTISLLCSREIYLIWNPAIQSNWPTPIWPYMTEKQSNRFTDFTFG